ARHPAGGHPSRTTATPGRLDRAAAVARPLVPGAARGRRGSRAAGRAARGTTRLAPLRGPNRPPGNPQVASRRPRDRDRRALSGRRASPAGDRRTARRAEPAAHRGTRGTRADAAALLRTRTGGDRAGG